MVVVEKEGEVDQRRRCPPTRVTFIILAAGTLYGISFPYPCA